MTPGRTKMHVLSMPSREPEPPSEPGDPHAAPLAKAGRFLRKLMEGGYFGNVTFSMQNGKLVACRTEQTMKIDEL